ncbi:MAG: penicillin acylase family protein, partial [Bacteroidota bacterium]
RIKYDRAYNKPLHAAPKLEPIFHLDALHYPEHKKSILLLKYWDREALVDSEAAALFILAFRQIKKQIKTTADFRTGNRLNEQMLIEAIDSAEKYCLKHFGKKHIPLGQLQRHSRGAVNKPVSGGPDVMAALTARAQEDGTLRAVSGDSYIELVRFSDAGVEIESIHAFGASAKANSPHYTDQMDMYLKRELKTMTLDKEAVYQSAKRIYKPK